MYKFLYLWMFWLILLILPMQLKTGGNIRSGMFLIYDAIDTSLWEIQPERMEATLWMDFESPLLSVSPYSFRVDRQSIIYSRVPPIEKRGTIETELIELNIETGLEISIIRAHWISLIEMPSSEHILIQFTQENLQKYCVLSFATDECSPASEELVAFLQDDAIIWQNDLGYVLTERALYHFDAARLSWELLLENQWYLAQAAAYDATRNRLYIAGNIEAPETRCSASQLMWIDLSSFEVALAAFNLLDCISPFDRMLISPDGTYLQYDTQDVVVLDLQTGELIYRPFWYSDRAMWMPNSQSLLFTYYEQINSSGNQISHVDVFTGETKRIYEGTAGYVWLYHVP